MIYTVSVHLYIFTYNQDSSVRIWLGYNNILKDKSSSSLIKLHIILTLSFLKILQVNF